MEDSSGRCGRSRTSGRSTETETEQYETDGKPVRNKSLTEHRQQGAQKRQNRCTVKPLEPTHRNALHGGMEMRKQDMENQFSKKTRKKARSIQAQRIFRSRWFKSLVAMGSVVVFCTVYSLIIPAATLTEDQASADAGIVLEEAAPSEPQPVEAPAETPAPEPVQEEAPKEEPVVQAAAAVEEAPAEQAVEAPAASETVTETPAEAASTAASTEQSLNESAAAGSGSEETKTENAETANTAAANETAPAEETSGTATDETATEGTDAALTTEETTEEASTADSEESVEETTGEEEEVGTVSELKGTSGNLEAVVRFAEGAGIPENATLAIYGGSADTGKVQDALWSGSMDSIEQSTITTDLSEYVSFAVKDVDGNDITPDSDCSIEISFGSEADLSDPGENKIKKYGTLVVGSDGNVSVTGTSLSTGDGHTYATFSGKLSGNTFGFAVTTADKKVNYLEGLSGKTSDGAVEASLTFGKDAKVPEGSTLTVESASVSESSVLDKLWGNYEGVDKDTVTADDVQFVKFVIRDKDGKEISPETKVSVKLTFHHEADLSSAAEGKVKKYNALAVSSDGTITLGSKALSAENGTTTASFADVSAKTAFGYAVTTVEKKAVYATRLTGKSEDGTIEASLRLTEEAKIPEGSLLKVTPVTGETVQKTLLDNIWTDTSIIDPDTIELTDSGLAAVTITDKDGNALKSEADATLTLTFNKEADLKEAARKMVKRAKTVAMTEENVKLSDDGLSAAEGKTKVSYTGTVDGQTFGYAVSTAKQKTNFLEGKLTYEGEDYTIEVSVNKDNQIPEGSELKVKELNQDSEEFKKKLDQAAEAVQKDAEKNSSDDIETTIDDSSVRMFDITIQNEDGDEIQPNGDVSVSVQYKKAVKVSADAKMKAIHFDEKNEEVKVLTPETKADTSDTEKNVHEVKFDTNGFSVYAILGTEEGTTFTDGNLTADGDGYHITVSYDADAEIPEGAILEATELTGDDAASYVEKAAEKLGGEIASSRFFNIHILDKDGNKVQPKTAVKIKIIYDDPIQLEDGQEIKQVHFKDTDEASTTLDSGITAQSVRRVAAKKASAAVSSNDNIEVLDVTTEGGDEVQSVEFEQSSFSVTGTVVKALGDGWPDEGYYAVIVKSGNNYYAVGLDGSLTAVTYDASKKSVAFNEISDKSTLSSYRWEFVTESDIWGTYHYYLKGQASENSSKVYIDPTNDKGISYTPSELYSDNNYIYNGYLYLAINNNNTKLSYTFSRKYAAEVLFARDFTASGSDSPGHEGGEDIPAVSLGAPATNKSVTSNENGTYNISLSVTGKSQAQKARSTADIVIVFDRSGSMRFKGTSSEESKYGSGRRDYEAIKATKTLADTLLQNNTYDYPDTVRIGIVEFNNSARSALELTNIKTNIDKELRYNPSSKYDYVPLAGQDSTGTNWEAALQQAGTMLNKGRTDAAKYVIFVSDGNPTYYVYGGTGYETVENIRQSYEAAKDDAKTLVDKGASFYTLGVYGNASRMSNLTAYAYTGSDIGTYPAGHYQTATDTASLTAAFQNIINEINRNFTFSDVTLTDGITSLTSKAKIQGNAGQFTYSGTDTNGKKVDVPQKVQTARYDEISDSVVWNLGEGYEIPDGVTYTVSFTVWPTQQAYDIVAALQNGTISFKDPKATVNGKTVDWTYFVQNSDGTYSYRTNTSQTVTYKQVTKDSNGNVTNTSVVKTSRISSEPENPDMDLTNHQVTVKKIWNDSLDTDHRQAITLKIGYDEDNDGAIVKTTHDGQVVYDSNVITVSLDGTSVTQATATGTTVTTENGKTVWSKTISVAPGLIVGGQTLEPGHQYKVVETGSSYNYELNAPDVHPMLIDSATVVYDSTKPNTAVITATNNLRGGVNIQKKVVANDGATDISGNVTDEFSVVIHISKDGTAYKYSNYEITSKADASDTQKNAYPIWYTKYVFDSASAVNPNDVSAATSHSSDIVEDGETLTIKTNELIRLINVPIGSTYSVTEANIPNGYEQQSITAGGTVTANSSNTVIVTNKQKLTEITVKKTDDSTTSPTALGGVKFELTKLTGAKINDDGTTSNVWTAVTSTDITSTDGRFEIAEADKNNGKTISGLTVGTYRLREITAPAGYIVETSDTYFEVTIGTDGNATIDIVEGDASAVNSKASASGNTVTVQNKAGQALPSTGGPGTSGYLFGGLAMILAAGAIYLISKKRLV